MSGDVTSIRTTIEIADGSQVRLRNVRGVWGEFCIMELRGENIEVDLRFACEAEALAIARSILNQRTQPDPPPMRRPGGGAGLV